MYAFIHNHIAGRLVTLSIALLLILMQTMLFMPALAAAETVVETVNELSDPAEASTENVVLEDDSSTDEEVPQEAEEGASGDDSSAHEEDQDATMQSTGTEQSVAAEDTPSEGESLDGIPGDQTEGPLTGDAVVTTGDATAVADIEAAANTNTVSETTGTSTAASSTPQTTGTTTVPHHPMNTEIDTLTASSTNDAALDTDATSTANTGANSARGGTASIETGNAIAVANVINLANTNIINSTGFIEFFSSLGFSTIDLRDIFGIFDAGTSVSTPACANLLCGTDTTRYAVAASNTADIENDLTVAANTGGNSAVGAAGAEISTGNAIASANVFNIANTNITDSNYLLLAFDNLGNLDGDIVLPAAELFLRLFTRSSGRAGTELDNRNTASVDNTVSTNANTGGNSATGGSITTGDATSDARVINQVNQNLFGSDSFLLLIRVHGNWNGDIFGLPDGVSWTETPQGIQLVYESGAGGASSGNTYTVTNKNDASIRNNVSVFALTGENHIESNGGGNITTGNAYAAADVVNIVNTNVLGQNWALLIFDIFGDWNGNLAFGRPDLWVGAKATSPDSPIMPGSEVTYTFTVMNTGDTPATNVMLENYFADAELTYPGSRIDTNGHGRARTAWNIGTIPAGGSKEVSYTATVRNTLAKHVETPIELTASVYARETEDDMEDNSDTVTIYAGHERKKNGNPGMFTMPSGVEIVKTAHTDTTVVPAVVDYTIEIFNHGGPLYNAVLSDVLLDEAGAYLSEQAWDLGTIQTDEAIDITYSIEFTASTSPGFYTNSAQLVGTHKSVALKKSELYMSDEATAVVEIVANGAGRVLGASATCDPYLTEHMRLGAANSPDEVEKLQRFLNDHLGLELGVNGYFDETTDRAVKLFQTRYARDILSPWGTAVASGYVYITTKKKINEIVCGGSTQFPLTPAQRAEIMIYREGLLRGRGTDFEHGSQDIGDAGTTTPEYSAVPEAEAALLPEDEFREVSRGNAGDAGKSTQTGVSLLRSMMNRIDLWFGGISQM